MTWYEITGILLLAVVVGPVVLGFVVHRESDDPDGAARSYDYPVQYEVRIWVMVNAETPEEAALEAQNLIRDYPITAEVFDPRGRKSVVTATEEES